MKTQLFSGPKEPRIEAKLAAKREAWASRRDLINTRHLIYLGDARSMRPLKERESVHLVVTSPPYWTLKAYRGEAAEAQLGHVTSYARFLEELDRVWRRCFDLLVPGGRMCVVVGDVCLSRRAAGRHMVMPLHADITVRLREVGFDYLSPIFWYKIANAATEVEGNGGAFLGKPYEPNAVVKNDVEYILLFRKPGGYRRPSAEQRALSIIDPENHQRWFRQVWDDLPGASTRDHPAPFPEELAHRLIGMFSFVGDVVLDPFWGTGSTTAAAIRAYRSSIGFEIERQYFEAGKRRFAQASFGATVSFLHADEEA